MPVTKDDVLAALGKVAAPDGTPLPKTATLSDIVASDGKVLFSITVDARAVQNWEPVRHGAADAVEAIRRGAAGGEARRGRADRRAQRCRGACRASDASGSGRPRTCWSHPRPWS